MILSNKTDTGAFRGRVLRVLVVDQHPLVRRGVGALLAAEPDMWVFPDEPEIRAALLSVMRQAPDAVVVGVGPRGGDRFGLVRRVRRMDGRVPIVAIAVCGNPDDARLAARAGASAFLFGADAGADLVPTVRRVCSTRHLRRPPHATAVGGIMAARPASLLDEIERGVLVLTGRGMPADAIAVRLRMSRPSIDAALRSLKVKLGVGTSVALVARCVQGGAPAAGR
jgi:two-component system NarL family response regulator